jgi:hypothetical protein
MYKTLKNKTKKIFIKKYSAKNKKIKGSHIE